jgi:hypothetical protein
MSYLETIQVINELALEVRNFERSKDNTKWKWSCLVCGDSKKDQRKARFGVSRKKNEFVCHCFNCGYSAHFNYYLKEYHPHLSSKLSVSIIKESMPSLYSQDDLISQLPTEILKHIFYNGNVEKLRDIKLNITLANQEKLKEAFND